MSVLTFWALGTLAQDHTQDAQSYQAALDAFYKDKAHSPLTPKDRRKFSGHTYFPLNDSFRVVASFEYTPDAQPFEMPTSGWKTPAYVLYGKATFEFNGRSYTLEIYKNLVYSKEPDYDGHLFLPFTDLTSGVLTYGGGRYIEVSPPEGDTIIIDFNKAYNPYCAYSDGWNCPIVPKANDLELSVRAGIMFLKKGF
jgi:uncharacterized protein (DUF1684 family)